MSAQDVLDNDHSGLLSDATLTALQLHHQPFTSQLRDAAAQHDDEAAQAPLHFSDAITEEQLADIKQALITGDDLLLVLGENGSGKSTLLEQLSANSGLRIQCFAVSGSQRFSTMNLFAGMLEAFKQKPPEKLKDILDELIPCLQSMVARNTLSAIVLDDAHLASKSELTQLLSAMLYVNSQDETLMRVALAATSDFEDMIPDLLPDGADLPYSILSIEGFTPARAAAYLDYRLQLAGFDQEFPFTERDMASLVDHSEGKPVELHALTADVLNEKYGRIEHDIPQELISEEGAGFFQSRPGKLILGALATVLIIGGLLMFMPQGNEQDRGTALEPTTMVEPDKSAQTAPELKLIESTPAPVADETDASATAAANSNNSEAITDENSAENATPSTGAATVEADVTESTTETTQNNEDADTTASDNAIASATVPTVEADTNTQSTDSEPSNSEEASPTDTTTTTAETQTSTTDTDQTTTTDTAQTTTADAVQASNSETANQSPSQSDSSNEQTNAGLAAAAPVDNQSDTAQTPAAEQNDDALENLLESPSWILVQDENQFTVQMSASRDLASVQNFLRRNPLPGPNSIFSFERNGDVWYALVHGVFPTLSEARLAVEQMPDGAQRDQPWIRSVSRVKAILLEQ